MGRVHGRAEGAGFLEVGIRALLDVLSAVGPAELRSRRAGADLDGRSEAALWSCRPGRDGRLRQRQPGDQRDCRSASGGSEYVYLAGEQSGMAGRIVSRT